MTLRLRLALWYGALLAIVVAAGFTIAYLIHASFPHEGPDPAFEASLERLRLTLFAVGVIGVAVAVLGGWVISGSALRPIRTMIETARAIALSRGFSRRIDVLGGASDELGELGQTFNDMLASLDEAYRRQQRFVADVSHELRTPLTSIQGDLELLSRDLPEHERLATLAEARREARRLARLVDDLLVLVRADAGPQPFVAKPVQLDELVMEVFRDLRPQAGARLQVVDLDEAMVLGERDRLKQLVLILVDNALRYAPEGGASVSVGVSDAQCVLVVDDEGIGITADVAARAFERFFRGEEAIRLDPSGTGLGLAIARWIVDRHGGAIALERRQPRGTRAVVRLPAVLLGVALLLAACGPGPATAPPTAGTADPAVPAAMASAAPAAGDLGERSSEGGAIAVKASWASIEPPVVKLTLDTHSVELDRFDLVSAASVRVDGGEWLAPTAADVPKGGHHRSGTVTFGAVPAAAFGSARLIELRIVDIGVPERLLRWERAR